MIDIGRTAPYGLFPDPFSGLGFGAHEQYLLVLGSHGAKIVHCLSQHRQCLFQIDDMDFFAVAKKIGRHGWGPVPCLVSEVCTRFEKLAHGNVSHIGSTM